MYLLLLSVIYLAFVSLGLPDSLLGAAWPTIRAELDVLLSYMGIVSMIMGFGTVVSGLLSERLTKKFGTKWVTIISVLISAISIFGFSYSESLWYMCLWAVPYGLSAGAIDAALNNYVALHYASKHMSWLHCFWGVGTIVSPYIMSYAVTHSSWNNGYRTVAYVQLLIVVILFLTVPLWKINITKDEAVSNAELLGLRGTFKIKGVPYLLIGFLCYCAAEATAMQWASSYIEIARGASKEAAAACGALFFIGITVGRFFGGFIADKMGDYKMIWLGIVIALIGVACIIIPQNFITFAGFVIIGLGCAPIYPCIVHFTPSNFGEENSQGIIGVQMAFAYIGMTLMPPLFGIIANSLSIELMPLFLAFFFVLLIFMMMKIKRICKS